MKSGYKQTEVGVIPEEWALVPLVELIDESRSIRYGIVQPGKFDPAGRYMVRGQDYSTGWVAPSELFRVSPQVEEPFKNARVKTGDVVITIVGASTGHIEVIPDWLDGANLTQTTARLAINPAKAFSGFCKCYLQSAAGQRQVANYLKGAAQPGLNCGDIEKFRIPLPPTLPEQRAIATALSDVDGLLGGLDRLIAKKRDLKQAAMQQLLTGQTRLPGWDGAWEVSSVGREFEIKLGKMLDAEKNVGVPKPFLGNKAVQWDRIDLSDLPTVPMSRSDIERFRLRKGDLLVCEGGEVGRAAIWEAPIDECYYQKALHRLRPLRGFNSRLMAALLRLWSDRGLLSNYVTQTSIAHLPREKFMEVPMPVPPPAEQTAIASVLTEMDAELAVLTQRREKTRALKQAMMQELLTGRTRLI